MQDDYQKQLRHRMQREHLLNELRSVLLDPHHESPRQLNDPLVSLFADDSPLLELSISAGERYLSYVETVGCFCLLCPLIIPHLLALCVPCGLCVLVDDVWANAAANHLVLRERSLLFVFDGAVLPPVNPGGLYAPLCAPGARYTVPRIEICVPLSEDLEFKLLPPSNDLFKDHINYRVRTLVVSSMGNIVAAIDGPVNAEAFIAAVDEQRAKAVAIDIPESVYREHQRVIAGLGSTAVLGPIMAQMILRANTNAPQMAARMLILQSMIATWQQESIEAQRRLGFAAVGGSTAPVVAEMVRSEGQLPLLSVEEVGRGLEEVGLGKHLQAFARAHIDGPTLALLDEASLIELGVQSSLERKQILGWAAGKKTAAVKTAVPVDHSVQLA